MARRLSFLLLLVVGLVTTGCTVGPNYQRPETPLPEAYRGVESEGAPTQTSSSTFADLAWWKLFKDPDLQDLIRSALAENYDLRVAVARILQAQAQLTVTGSYQYPTLNAQVDAPYTGYLGGDRPEAMPNKPCQCREDSASAGSWTCGGNSAAPPRLRRAQLLASQDVREGVVISLVAQVAQAYFTLRSLDIDLEISKRTVISRQQSRELVQARLDGGVAGILDLQQAETLLYGATKTIPDIQRQIEQTENLICILHG